MTGRLYVRLECGYSGDVDKGVLTTLVGNVYAITRGNPSKRQVALPLGWDASPAFFDLPAGRYVVDVGLPSGEVLSEDVEIRDSEDVNVQFELTDSPYESHTLQYVVGNIEPSAVYHSHGSYPVPQSYGSRAFGQHEAVPYAPDGQHEAVPEAPDYQRPLAEVALLKRSEAEPLPIEKLNGLRKLQPLVARQRVAELLGQPAESAVMQPRYPEPFSPIFRLDENAMANIPLEGHPYQYLTATAAGDAYLITVPWPWPDAGGGMITIEVLLNLRQSPTGSAISVAVRDPVVGGGLGYLSSGSLQKAAVVFRDVESMLYSKVSNPLGAAAGGYVLIGTETSGEPQRWEDWLTNLREWFPQLSDGAILWGARRLRTARMQSHVDDARAALLEGYERGLPVYTLGLTWLIDGLSAFPEDPRCAAALQQVRELCWRVDMREPFVVLRLGED
jgi:hypothetical protein